MFREIFSFILHIVSVSSVFVLLPRFYFVLPFSCNVAAMTTKKILYTPEEKRMLTVVVSMHLEGLENKKTHSSLNTKARM